MKEKLYALMQGRYGVDTLNQVLMITCILFLFLNIFVQSIFLSTIGYTLWVIALYRMFSKKIYKRYAENEKFMQLIAPITRMQSLHQKRKQDPSHKYYRCPKCRQILRVPKGHGQVIITCPQCQTQIHKRT